MDRRRAAGFLVALCLGMTALGQSRATTLQTVSDSLPREVDGWQLADPSEVYGPESLFDYINGGAELYISYGFVKMTGNTYVGDTQGEIKVDIFDMGSSESAFGVFTHSREAIDDFVDAQIESEYAGGLLTFWKGSFYVSILAYPETEPKRDVVRQLARHIAGRIQEGSERPAILELLPPENLDALSPRFFRHHLWQNGYGFITQDNLFGIGADTDAVLAKYGLGEPDQQPTLLILVAYPDPGAAGTALRAYTREYLGAESGGPTQLSDGLWSAGQVTGRHLCSVFRAPNGELAERLLSRVADRVRESTDRK